MHGSQMRRTSVLGVPAWTAQLRLDLLLKINPSCRARIAAVIMTSASCRPSSSGAPKPRPSLIASRRASDTLAGTFSQAQRRVGQRILPVALPQAVRERNDPGVGGDQGQIRVRVTAEDEEAISDDLGPESAFSGPPLAHLAVDDAGSSVQEKQPTQLAWRHVDLKLDADTTRHDVWITWRHQLDARTSQRKAGSRLLLVPDGLVFDLPASLAEDRRSGVWILGCKQGASIRDSKTQAVACFSLFHKCCARGVRRGVPILTRLPARLELRRAQHHLAPQRDHIRHQESSTRSSA